MAVKSRRKAREAALTALYQIEISQTEPLEAFNNASEALELADDQKQFGQRVTLGIIENLGEIDNGLAKVVTGYDFDRIAVIDRNVLRVAAFELLFEPAIPPAVTINEAIEIGKKYSTAESGRFINGVLGNYVKSTVKATWDPSTAPAEEQEEKFTELIEEPEEELIDEQSAAETKAGKRFGPWTIQSDDVEKA